MRRTPRTDSPSAPAGDVPTLRLHRPDDLIAAIPYLVGFYPHDSLVLIGLGEAGPARATTRVRVVARLDIADLRASSAPVDNAVRALVGAQARSVVVVFYAAELHDAVAGRQLGSITALEQFCADAGVAITSFLFVGQDAWATGGYHDDGAEGAAFTVAGPFEHIADSRIQATATYAGLVARPDREAVAALLAPHPAERRDPLLPALRRARAARLDCSSTVRARCHRSDIRAIFAATRTLPLIGDAQTIRFGSALADIAVRDACWLALEAGRIEGESLWQELSRSLPDEYRAPALFLFGWQQWRRGAGAMAAMAVEAALRCDPTYHAAELLDGALAHGLDPFRTPRLRRGT